MIAAVHTDPRLSVPLAIIAAGAVLWYWVRLGRSDVPRGRRLIRRSSATLVLLTLPAFVRGLSYVDPDTDQHGYVIAWSVVTLLVLIVLVIACIDAIMTVRHEQHVAGRELLRTVSNDAGEPPAGSDQA